MTTTQKVAIGGAVILVAAALFFLLQDGEEEQPPIIVEGGSITLTAKKGQSAWRQHGNERRYEQHHPGGRNVTGFTASSGQCSVSGQSITITTSDGTIESTLHRPLFPFWKKHADVTVNVAGKLEVDPNDRAVLRLETTATLMSFTNGGQGTCTVTNGRVDVDQIN
jgi:hypothetical protein